MRLVVVGFGVLALVAGLVLAAVVIVHVTRQYEKTKDIDPGCTVHYPENDPTSVMPKDGDVVEWRCMDDGQGHLRLRARVKRKSSQ